MKIGIDISQVAYEGTGVARYTDNLIHSLVNHDTNNEYVFFYGSLRRPISNELAKLIQGNHELVTYPLPPTMLDLLWNKLHWLSIETLIGDVDVFVSSDWSQPPIGKAKSVTIVHDLVVYKYPETSHSTTEISLSDMNIAPNIVAIQKRRLKWVKKECDHIIADSQSTKKDLVQLLSLDSSKISVVYPAVSGGRTLGKSSQKRPKRPFCLSVGKLEPRKNIKRLIQAFQQADFDDLDLYIVGQKGWGEHNIKPDSRIKLLGHISDEKLNTLYNQAEFFIYPSLYEGFGYPIIEAMAAGCPVATSNRSSTGELAKGRGELFNPERVSDIQKAIEKLHTHEKLRKTYATKGKKYAQKFSQKNFADTFLKVLNTV